MINHKVSFKKRMKQKQHRWGNIRLEVGARITLQEKRKEHQNKRKEKRREGVQEEELQ